MSILLIAKHVPSPGIRRRPKCKPCPFDADLFLIPQLPATNIRLDEAELGGGNVEGIDIGGEAGKGLLGAVRAVSLSVVILCIPPKKATYRIRVLILTVSMS
jgi:hypothetical protein